MSDIIKLPSGVEVYEGRVLVIPGIGVVMPVGDLTPAEVQALRDDVASVLGLGLGDLSDVNADNPASGEALVWDGSDWVPAPMVAGITLVSRRGVPIHPDAKALDFWTGFTVEQLTGGSSHYARVDLNFGGSGTSELPSRADHRHPPTLKGRQIFDRAGAVLGAGTSTLIDFTATGLVSSVIYDVDIRGSIEVVNTNQSGRLMLRAQIGNETVSTNSRGFSGGVWSEASVSSARMSVTGVTSLRLQFWVEYQSGDPTALYTSELTYAIDPRGGQQ